MIVLKRNGEPVSGYTPTYNGKHLVVAIDSSKSNTAIIVGDTTGRVYDDYEISGSGEDVDVYQLCKYTRRQLRQLFLGADIMCVGIENIITKKSKYGQNTGMEIHNSRYKITAVFDNLIFAFQEYHQIDAELINNWTWKSTVLPANYRTQAHKKGSKDYLKDIGHPLGNRKDDVTDAYCIYKYIVATHKFEVVESITTTTPTTKKYTYTIVPENASFPNCKKFEIMNDDNLIHNIEAVCNHIDSNTIAQFKWPIDMLDINTIYSGNLRTFGKNVFTRSDKYVLVIVGLNDG